MAGRTREQIEKEIERRVEERVKAALEEHKIDQDPADLNAVLMKLAQVMEKQTDVDAQRNEREEILYRASTKEFHDREEYFDPSTFNVMKEARERASKLGYTLGPWRPAQQRNASPLVEAYPFWYISNCQQTGAECQVRWNPPVQTTGGKPGAGGWWPSIFGRAVTVPRYGARSMIEKWAQARGLPANPEFATGGGMSGGGMGSGRSVEGVHDQ